MRARLGHIGMPGMFGVAALLALALAVVLLFASTVEAQQVTKLDPPTNLKAVPTDGGLQVSWTNNPDASIGRNQNQLIGWGEPYGLWINPRALRSTLRDKPERIGGNPSSYTITGLTNGTRYAVSVAHDTRTWTDNQNDRQYFRTRSDFVHVQAIAGAPAPPDAPTVAAVGSGLSVSWTAPSDNGAAITAYRVRHRKSDETGWTGLDHTDTTTLRTAIGDLEPGAEHDVQVRAQNSRGWSPWSSVRSGKTSKAGGL